MIKDFKPMLADDANLGNLKFPLLVSPKLDGVRATSLDGVLRTRSLKLLPNRSVNDKFNILAPLDGELILGEPTSPSVFRDTMKAVMSHSGDIQDLRYYVFDLVSDDRFVDRLDKSTHYCNNSSIIHLPHKFVETEAELYYLEDAALSHGYEGLMLRDPEGAYKFGRATAREGTLLKLKRRKTSEAIIIGFVEQMHNANEAKMDNLGYTERSSHQANLVPTGVLGALVVRDAGVEFNVGTGFTAEDRASIWRKRHELIGSLITYEYLPIGIKDKPRHPVFKGFRMKEDT